MSDLAEVYLKARRHLGRRDAKLKAIISRIGACTLQHNPDRFGCLARAIISQQISGKAAAAISGRLDQALGPKGINARGILKMSDEALRKVGLSTNKCRAVRDLAEKVHEGMVPLAGIHDLPDEDVIAKLILVRGIGRWTAEMFLIFSLGRLDVLPVDDFGLRAGVKRHYGLKDLPARKDLQTLGEPWRPYRTIGTWYIWRSLGGVPQSEG